MNIIDPIDNISIGYNINIVNDYTDKLECIDLKNGNKLWQRELSGDFSWNDFFYLNDSTIAIVASGLQTMNIKVTAMELPRIFHDFGGFPKKLFEEQYPAKGSPELDIEMKELLKPTSVELDETWRMDHGAWSVIKHLYTNSDIPVIQLIINYTQPAMKVTINL